MLHLTVHVHVSSSFIKIHTDQPAVIGHHRGNRAAPKTGSFKIYNLSINNFDQIQVLANT